MRHIKNKVCLDLFQSSIFRYIVEDDSNLFLVTEKSGAAQEYAIVQFYFWDNILFQSAYFLNEIV